MPVVVLLRVAIPIADRRTGLTQRMTSADSDPHARWLQSLPGLGRRPEGHWLAAVRVQALRATVRGGSEECARACSPGVLPHYHRQSDGKLNESTETGHHPNRVSGSSAPPGRLVGEDPTQSDESRIRWGEEQSGRGAAVAASSRRALIPTLVTASVETCLGCRTGNFAPAATVSECADLAYARLPSRPRPVAATPETRLPRKPGPNPTRGKVALRHEGRSRLCMPTETYGCNPPGAEASTAGSGNGDTSSFS